MTTDVRANLRAIEEYINRLYVDREDAAEALNLAAITGYNVLFFGQPGTGKSAVARSFSECMGARLFVRQLHQMMGEEDINGPLDAKAFENGEWIRRIDGYYPTARLALFEEIDKVGPAVTSVLLTAWNERLYVHGDSEIRMPTLFNIGTVNAMLDDPTGAAWDRWDIRVMFDYLGDGDFLKMLLRDDQAPPPVVLSTEDVRDVQADVRRVHFGREPAEALREIRATLRQQGVTPSDRRYDKARRMAQASAWIDGRTEVAVGDLGVLRYNLWITPEQRKVVDECVLEVASPLAKDVLEAAGVIDDLTAKLAEAAGGSKRELVSLSIAGRAQLNQTFEELTRIVGSSTGRVQHDAARLRARIPDMAAQLLYTSGQTRSIEAARAAVSMDLGVS